MTRQAEREVWQALRALVLERYDSRHAAAEALGMSYVRIKALRHIAAGPMPMADLVAVLGTDRPYTTIVVDDLERRGLVTRSPHPDDRRAKIVTATAEGKRAARKATAIQERPPEAIRRLSDTDLAELRRLLDLLQSS
jgi:DNA-binding MarR family transcriptional regulator